MKVFVFAEVFAAMGDLGEFGALRDSAIDRRLSKELWGEHSAPAGVRLRHSYTRTACFSDMNHLTTTSYYRTRVLPIILRRDLGYPHKTPENMMQDHCTSVAPPRRVNTTYPIRSTEGNTDESNI